MKKNNYQKFIENDYDKILMPKKTSSALTKKAIKRLCNTEDYFVMMNESSNKIKVKKAVYPIRKWHLQKIAESLVFKTKSKLLPFEGTADSNYYLKVIRILDPEISEKLTAKNGANRFFGEIDDEVVMANREVYRPKNERDYLPDCNDLTKIDTMLTSLGNNIKRIKTIKKKNRLSEIDKKLEVRFRSIRSDSFKLSELKRMLLIEEERLLECDYKCIMAEIATEDSKSNVCEFFKSRAKEINDQVVNYENLMIDLKLNDEEFGDNIINVVESIQQNFAVNFKYKGFEFLQTAATTKFQLLCSLFLEGAAKKETDEEKLEFWIYHNYKYRANEEINPDEFIELNKKLSNSRKRKLFEIILDAQDYENWKIPYKTAIFNIDNQEAFMVLFSQFPIRLNKSFKMVDSFDKLKGYIGIKEYGLIFCSILYPPEKPIDSVGIMKIFQIDRFVVFKKRLGLLLKTALFGGDFSKMALDFFLQNHDLNSTENLVRAMVEYFSAGSAFNVSQKDFLDFIINKAPFQIISNFMFKSVAAFQKKKISTQLDLKNFFIKTIASIAKSINSDYNKWKYFISTIDGMGFDSRWFFSLRKKGTTNSMQGINHRGYIETICTANYINQKTNNQIIKMLSKTYFQYCRTFEFYGSLLLFKNYLPKFKDEKTLLFISKAVEDVYYMMNSDLKRLTSYFKKKNRSKKKVSKICNLFEICYYNFFLSDNKLNTYLDSMVLRKLRPFLNFRKILIDIKPDINLDEN